MDDNRIKKIIKDIKKNRFSEEDALRLLKDIPYQDLGFPMDRRKELEN